MCISSLAIWHPAIRCYCLSKFSIFLKTLLNIQIFCRKLWIPSNEASFSWGFLSANNRKKKKKPRLLRREFYTLLADSGEGKWTALLLERLFWSEMNLSPNDWRWSQTQSVFYNEILIQLQFGFQLFAARGKSSVYPTNHNSKANRRNLTWQFPECSQVQPLHYHLTLARTQLAHPLASFFSALLLGKEQRKRNCNWV